MDVDKELSDLIAKLQQKTAAYQAEALQKIRAEQGIKQREELRRAEAIVLIISTLIAAGIYEFTVQNIMDWLGHGHLPQLLGTKAEHRHHFRQTLGALFGKSRNGLELKSRKNWVTRQTVYRLNSDVIATHLKMAAVHKQETTNDLA